MSLSFDLEIQNLITSYPSCILEFGMEIWMYKTHRQKEGQQINEVNTALLWPQMFPMRDGP